jgi:hypothetical protein
VPADASSDLDSTGDARTYGVKNTVPDSILAKREIACQTVFSRLKTLRLEREKLSDTISLMPHTIVGCASRTLQILKCEIVPSHT